MVKPPPDNIPIKRADTMDSIKTYGEYATTSSPETSPSWQAPSTVTSEGSTSNSSTSPPGPMTPPTRAERSRSRYGDLGRVPLHRRGTSKTYERLEDLLKEAGYKETRVFTPETERLEAAADSDRRADENRLSSMGAVVDFLTNLFPAPGGRDSRQLSTSRSRDEYSPPPSPLEERRSVRSPVTPSNLTSSMDSFDELTPRASRHVSEARLPLPNQSFQRYGASDLSSRPSESSLLRSHPSPTLAQPKPSRARAYLRHMASTASMPPPRPQSTPANGRPYSTRTRDKYTDDPSIIFNAKGNGEGEEDHRGQPPLPHTWLETVTRAMLSTGSGHLGGPMHVNHSRKQPALRTTRSSLSQGSTTRRSNGKRRTGLSDQTNTPLPPLLTMIERGRAGRSESEVSRTKVVCRSAPGSRTSSLVRRGSEKGQPGRGRGDKWRRGKNAEKDRLPSLARTQVEGDPWNNGRGRTGLPHASGMTANEVKTLYLRGGGAGGKGGKGAGAGSSLVNDYDDNVEEGAGTSEDDEDGELGLAQMLVHPKRQQSIRSLRKHLEGVAPGEPPLHVRTARGPSFSTQNYVKSPLSEDDDWGQEWGSGWVRRGGGSAGADDEDDSASFARVFGDLNNRVPNNRTRPSFSAWGGRDEES